MRHRVEKLRALLSKHDLDAFLINSQVNIRYLFGFTGSNALALVTPEASFFITDRRYIQQAEEQVLTAERIIAKKDLASELKNIAGFDDMKKVGVEALHMNLKEYAFLKKTFSRLKIVACERNIEKIVSVKRRDEISNIGEAAAIVMAVFEEIRELIKPGMTELEVSAELSYRTRKHGSETDPFEPIVASGRRSALPHGISSRKRIDPGDMVIIDFGAVVNGYSADFTRTVIVGDLTTEQRRMAEVVESALLKAQEAARPGLTGRELDGVARAHIAEAGFGELFQHSLGHGLGLQVHEMPRIGELSNDPIEAGNVITLEPGLYHREHGGIRIEDDFVITESGAENLTPYPREVVRVG